jgi:type 1 glutamine amidotransferase
MAGTAVLDCPLRDAPFSADSPLIDLLLSPEAKAIVSRDMGAALDRAPPRFMGTQTPSFAAILTLRKAAGFFGMPADAVDRADGELRKLAVTDADRRARCARYDDDRLEIPAARKSADGKSAEGKSADGKSADGKSAGGKSADGKSAGGKSAEGKSAAGAPRLLIFEKINGFKDTPGVEAAHALFVDLARENGWSVTSTEKGGAIRAETLRNFDAVIWNNVSGDVLTLTQRKALQAYLENGGGFLAVHGSAGDPAYFWDWYADTLIGARFAGHPMSPQFQDAKVRLETPSSPLAKGLPAQWTMNDERYSYTTNPRKAGAKIQATLDENTYAPKGVGGQDLRMGDHPIAWSKCLGKGRMFYSAIGHRPETYSIPEYRTMVKNALAWVSQREACVAGE